MALIMNKLNFDTFFNPLIIAVIFSTALFLLFGFFFFAGIWTSNFIVVNYDYAALVTVSFPYILIISFILLCYSSFLTLKLLTSDNFITYVKWILSMCIICFCFSSMSYMQNVDNNEIASTYGQNPADLNVFK